MKNIQDLRIFIQTARLGSLSACARHLDLSPAVVSASIKRLEADIDTLLFVRSTRQLRLTDKGEQFLQYCTEAMSILDNGYALLHEEDCKFAGTLKISAPSDLGRTVLLPWLDEFMGMYPRVSLQLQASDSYADLYGQNIDIAVRYGLPKDSNMVALPVALDLRPVVCAAPSYLAKHGVPTNPEELSEHNCLCLGLDEKYYDRWIFERGDEKLSVDVTGNRRSKDGEVVKRWALAGQGIAWKSYLDIHEDLANSRLIALEFEKWQTPKYPLYVLFPERRMIDPLFKAFREFLVAKINAVLNN